MGSKLTQGWHVLDSGASWYVNEATKAIRFYGADGNYVCDYQQPTAEDLEQVLLWAIDNGFSMKKIES